MTGSGAVVRSERPEWPDPSPPLTRRQYEVLALSATGASASEVAHELGVGYSAVHQMLMRIYRMHETGGLVETYWRRGWLRPL